MIPMIQKQETRRGGIFEDVQRPWAQTLSLTFMHFARMMSVLVACWSWAKVWEAYEPTTGKLSDLLTIALLAVSLIIGGVAFIRIDDHFEASVKSRGVIAGVCIIAVIAFNLAIAPVIVFSLIKIQSNLIYLLPITVTIASWAVFTHFKVGQYSFVQELTRQTPTNSEGYWIKQLEQEFEREKRDMGDELQSALDTIDQLNERIAHLTNENVKYQTTPTKVFVPLNHGTARALNIGNRVFNPDEQSRLSMFIGGWHNRGTSRDNWTTREAEKKFGWRIAYPEWTKFIEALRGMKILDDANRPTVEIDKVISILKLPPYPTHNGSGESVSSSNHDTTRHDTVAG